MEYDWNNYLFYNPLYRDYYMVNFLMGNPGKLTTLPSPSGNSSPWT